MEINSPSIIFFSNLETLIHYYIYEGGKKKKNTSQFTTATNFSWKENKPRHTYRENVQFKLILKLSETYYYIYFKKNYILMIFVIIFKDK